MDFLIKALGSDGKLQLKTRAVSCQRSSFNFPFFFVATCLFNWLMHQRTKKDFL